MNRFFKPIKYLGILTVVIVISAVITYIINPNLSVISASQNYH